MSKSTDSAERYNELEDLILSVRQISIQNEGKEDQIATHSEEPNHKQGDQTPQTLSTTQAGDESERRKDQVKGKKTQKFVPREPPISPLASPGSTRAIQQKRPTGSKLTLKGTYVSAHLATSPDPSFPGPKRYYKVSRETPCLPLDTARTNPQTYLREARVSLVAQTQPVPEPTNISSGKVCPLYRYRVRPDKKRKGARSRKVSDALPGNVRHHAVVHNEGCKVYRETRNLGAPDTSDLLLGHD
jgi:hypothetical protein